MRKENSTFKAAFLSSEGTHVFNNDHYGSAELDKFACYVIADGVENADRESDSAKMAVDAAIEEFLYNPSIKKKTLKKCVMAAHRALQDNPDHKKMKASITVVITDYQKVRFAYVGNTRFYLYRSGRLLLESEDHSLSWQLAKQDEIKKDKIAWHSERSNLSRYLGQEEKLVPEVSRKIKLEDGDIFALLTRGVWEHCDSGDIKAALDSAESEPELALDSVERLILDPHPDEIDNYTIATVFVDKVFIDPNKKKKIKRILAIAIPVFVVLVALIILLVVLNAQKKNKIEKMEYAYVNGIEYIEDNNFIRAKEEFDTAFELADDVNDKIRRNKIGDYLKLVEAIVTADNHFADGNYEDAESSYLIAQDRSRYTDNMGKDYIEARLKLVAKFISVNDLLTLGDEAADKGEYATAETNYIEARRIAAEINYQEGKSQAVSSLTLLYEKMAQESDESSEESQNKADLAVTAAGLEAQGDKAVQDGDLSGAKLYYNMAREKYVELADDISVMRIDEKLANLGDKQTDTEAQRKAAKEFVAEGDRLFAAGDYAGAKAQYILARNIYSRLNDEENLSIVQGKIETVDAYMTQG